MNIKKSFFWIAAFFLFLLSGTMIKKSIAHTPSSVGGVLQESFMVDTSFLLDEEISREEKIYKIKILVELLEKRIQEIITQRESRENIVLAGNAFDFYSRNIHLENAVKREFEKLSDKQKAGMVLMVAFDKNSSFDNMKYLIQILHVGGILTLSKNPDKELIDTLESYNGHKLPLLFAADAESSLLKYRFPHFESQNKDMGETSDIKSESKSREIAQRISDMLWERGFDINFAPVYDTDLNQEVISSRSFSSENSVVQALAGAFMEKTQEEGIFATAKHFPGHGNVVGDSHKLLPVIRGDLVEIENFKKAIEQKVVFMMVGHLAIEQNEKWDTDGFPATISKKIVTNLLKEDLGFEGVIVTDAMNMKGVAGIENAEIKALKAGVDIVLMPQNPQNVIQSILKGMNEDDEFRREMDQKVRKIIRLKIISAWNRGEF